MPVGTARMVHLALPSSELHRGVLFHDNTRVNGLLEEPGTALLFPGEDALDPRALSPGEVRNLIVIDGTWWQARKVLKQNPQLLRLPRIGLRPERPGNYRIRREPSAECLATIEAVSDVLGVLEGAPEQAAAMLAAFTFMVNEQLAHAATRTTPKRRRRPRQRDPSDTERLLASLPRVVLAHAEVNAHSRHTPVPGPPELLHLVARRTTGEVFEATLTARRPLAPNAARHLEIEEDRILFGESVESMRARWQAFSRPDDLVAAWGTYTGHLLATEGLPATDYVDLRAAVANHFQTSPGAPAQALERLGAGAPVTVISGRAGKTVGVLEQIVAALAAARMRRSAPPDPPDPVWAKTPISADAATAR